MHDHAQHLEPVDAGATVPMPASVQEIEIEQLRFELRVAREIVRRMAPLHYMAPPTVLAQFYGIEIPSCVSRGPSRV